MNKITENTLPFDKAIGDILGIVNCLMILTDTNAFGEWLKEYHRGEISNNYLPGYKLTFNTLFRMLTSELERNTSLGLISDDIFDRATFHGIPISKVPNTSDKAILVRNLQYYFNLVITSNDWPDLEVALKKTSIEVLTPFNNIKQVSSLNNKYHVSELELVVKYSSIFQTYIFLNDTSRGIPHGYLPTMLDDQEYQYRFRHSESSLFANAFWGYKFTVQYLWYQLLKDQFFSSTVNDIHKTTDWNAFDKYFDKIKLNIIEPLEKSTGGVMGYDFFILINNNPRIYIKGLLEKKIPEIALSKQESFRRVFLWYPIQLVDSSDYSFSGAPIFKPLLMGLIQIKRRSSDKTKAKVVRIIHGTFEEHRRSYSYAIFSELSGFISDASGWMLFFDCCDDRGSTSDDFQQIETLLNRYSENNFIEITNIQIEKDTLLAFLKDVQTNTRS